MEILKKSVDYPYPGSTFTFFTNILDNSKEREVVISDDGDNVVCGDFAGDKKIILLMNRKELECSVLINDGLRVGAYSANTHEMADFLEVNLGYRFDEDENPENICAFTGEILRLI